MKQAIFLVSIFIIVLVVFAGCQKQIAPTDSGTQVEDKNQNVPTSGSADAQSVDLVDENPVEIGELY